MKKTLTLLAVGLLGMVPLSRAQFNKTFVSYINASGVSAKSVDIIDDGNGTVSLGYAQGNIILRKLDLAGTIVASAAYAMHGDGIPERIIKTPNGDYIVAGYSGDAMFAMRVDNSFNLMWGVIHEDMASSQANGDERQTVNIVLVENPVAGEPESYIMTGVGGIAPVWNTGGLLFPVPSSPSPNPSFPNQPISAISALRMDGTNGSMMWHQKFFSYEVSRPATLQTVRREYPNALVYGNDKYFIGGAALAHRPNLEWVNFSMTINRDGDIIDWYTEFTYPNHPIERGFRDHDAIYDQDRGQFVMSFTIDELAIQQGDLSSEIGIATFDQDANPIGLSRYFDNSLYQNYAFSIAETKSHDGYIVSGKVSSFPVPIPAGSPQIPSATSLLKVDKALKPIFYRRYNQSRSVAYKPTVTSVANGMAAENYVIATTPIDATSDMRVISTDIFGRACGTVPQTPVHIEESLITNTVFYLWGNDLLSLSPIIENQLLETNETDCNVYGSNGNDVGHYKPTSVTDVSDKGGISLYPTVLEGNNMVTIETNLDKAIEAEMRVVSIDGRTISVSTIMLEKGNNKTAQVLPVDIVGSYFIKISSNDKALNQTFKIIKQ